MVPAGGGRVKAGLTPLAHLEHFSTLGVEFEHMRLFCGEAKVTKPDLFLCM